MTATLRKYNRSSVTPEEVVAIAKDAGMRLAPVLGEVQVEAIPLEKRKAFAGNADRLVEVAIGYLDADIGHKLGYTGGVLIDYTQPVKCSDAIHVAATEVFDILGNDAGANFLALLRKAADNAIEAVLRSAPDKGSPSR